MTNLQKLINEIETVAFEVQFSVISNFKVMLRALDSDETVQQLIQVIQDNRNNAEMILERIQSLANDKREEGVMHTQDIKMLIYLYVLNAANYPNLTLAAIEKIHATEGFYWASKYAVHIQHSVQQRQTTNISYSIKPDYMFKSIKFKNVSLKQGINEDMMGIFDNVSIKFNQTKADDSRIAITSFTHLDSDNIKISKKDDKTNQVTYVAG